MRNELQLNRYDLIMLVGTRAMVGAGNRGHVYRRQ
jgi:hypothetical protein